MLSGYEESIGGLRALGLVAALAITGLVFQIIRTWYSLKHIPGPFFAKFTNLPRVGWVSTGKAQEYYQAAHQKYGDIVRFGPDMVSICNPEALSTIYPIRPGFPKGDFYAALRPYAHGSQLYLVFNTQNENMHKLMKTPIAPLFSLTNVVAFEELIDKVLSQLSEQLDKRFVGKAESFDLGQWLQFFAFECMGSMSFSNSYGFLEKGYDVDGMLDAIHKFFVSAAPFTQITWLDPWLKKNAFVYKLMKTPGMAIFGVVRKNIEQRRKDMEANKDAGRRLDGRKDFLARFLEIHENNKNLPPWASTAWTFSNVIAGSDTVGTVMQTCMCKQTTPSFSRHSMLLKQRGDTDASIPDNLTCHPETLSSLRKELEAGSISRQAPQWSEVNHLPYLNAVVQEAVRIHPPFAIPFERIVPAGGITVLDTFLPEGTKVAGNPYVMNRYKPIFGEDAENWRPERWLEGDESYYKKLESSILTWGSGRRVCLGKHIAIFEVKKLITFLVLNYDVQIEDPNALRVENFFFFKRSGFNCRIQKRVVAQAV